MICAICGIEIEKNDIQSLMIVVESANLQGPGKPRQILFSHDYCLINVLNPSIPFDSQLFIDMD